ncbi:unnamed protein product [Parajaminaea phylloscopi]
MIVARSALTALPAARAALRPVAVAAPTAVRSVTNLAKKQYTAHGRAEGAGRNGHAMLVGDQVGLEVKLGMPKELGGTGAGNNPEELFALTYSSCFLGALQLVARNAKEQLPADTAVDADVSIGPPEGAQGFAIAVDLKVTSSLSDKEKLRKLVDQAHAVCPYSNATRNNVPVKITVE